MNVSAHVNTLPEPLKHLAGRIMDTDTHEMLPAQIWAQEIGPIMEDLANHWLNCGIDINEEKNHPNVPGYAGDKEPIDPATIWNVKGPTSPGSADMMRRLDVMDAMGVKRQIMYPGAGLFAHYLLYISPEYGYAAGLQHEDRKAYGYELLKAYNDWGIKVANMSDRIRPALPLYAETVNDLMDKAKHLIDNGIRALWMLTGPLPGGKSPAHPDLEPFWDMLEKNKVVLCIHGGLESRIFGTDAWWDVPAFKGYKVFGEFRLDPWSMSHTQTTPRNFLLTAILGGVLDRHPDLRIAVTEAGADWIGHLCDHLDLWHAQDLGGVVKGEKRLTYRIPEMPSFYVKRNIRVTPFIFEPVDKYIRQYDLGDVLCFASDYPHVEGGPRPVDIMYARLKPFGDELLEKFFVTNGEWVLPD